jgi:predicted membrane protein
MVDPGTAKILFQLGTYGPLGVMVILLFILLLRCQKKNDELALKLVELSRESIKADTEHTETLRFITKVLDGIDRRLT